MSKPNNKKDLIKLMPYIRAYWKNMLLAVVTGMLNQLAAISVSAVGALMVGIAAGSRDKRMISKMLVVLIFLVAARVAMNYAEMWHAHKAAYGILANFRVLLYRSIERIAPGYIINKRSGEIASTLMADVELLEWFYAHTVGACLVAVVVPLITLAGLCKIHWLLPLVLLPWIVLAASTPFWFKKGAEIDGSKMRDCLAEVNAEVVDGIQGIKEIVSFAYESYYLKKLKKSNRSLTKVQLSNGRRLGMEDGLMNLFMSSGMLCVLCCSAFLVANRQINAQWYPVTIILAACIFTPVMQISRMARNFGTIQASARRVFSVLETPASVVDKVTEGPGNLAEHRISFENVTFRYKNELPDVLSNASFDVQPGETVALVGHSGAGKSTCANLMLRFWDPQSGSVKIGSYNVDQFTQKTLRDMIAVVPQDIYLFNASVLENIRLGMPEADEEKVRKAAKTAMADGFIQMLPKGYDTVVGERGLQLSGGQRQRIAIARALLKNAPILLLDEAVSNLDTENEQELQEALSKLRKGRTTLVIAHRLSTILSAGRIVVLDHGKVVETGTHAELLKKKGMYSKLIGSQCEDMRKMSGNEKYVSN